MSVSHEKIATRVLATEAGALFTLSRNLPPDLAETVETLLRVRGRVVLSGIGKSGHVARKISATLASTGTPSFYVHPAEASHGDLGMITPDDACILLSNSGETAELRDLIAHCRRFEIPVIGISRDPESTLMRASDFRLTIPSVAEACSLGMAPTTSTTLMMGLGDALAIAVMEARKFEAAEFRSFHPGGAIGAQLTQVRQIMRGADSLPLVSPDTPMSEVILTMTSGTFGVAGVIDHDGKLTGVITDGDLRRKLDGLLGHLAKEVCSRNPISIPPETLAADALAIINKNRIGVLFVCEDSRPIGILHLHDLLRIGVK